MRQNHLPTENTFTNPDRNILDKMEENQLPRVVLWEWEKKKKKCRTAQVFWKDAKFPDCQPEPEINQTLFRPRLCLF